MKYVLHTSDKAGRELMGGKAYALAALRKQDFNIPEWFVISPLAFTETLKRAGLATLQPKEASKAIASLEIPREVQSEIYKALEKLKLRDYKLAVRSSGVIEDGNESSFAGQFESHLNVPSNHLLKYIKKVWESGFTTTILEYYKQRGIDPLLSPPAVLVQKMVKADQAGVLFTLDPVSKNYNHMVISATRGLGDKLMTGEIDGDTYITSRAGKIIKASLVEENNPALTPDLCRKITRLASKLEKHFKCPQDIEWAIEKDKLYLLQARPITTATTSHESEATTLWDNSNIVESYGGIVSPLTFSFASTIYAAVYKRFAEIMGVSRKEIQDNNVVYENCLGFINGRMYYNLINWYKMIVLLPGFTLNSKFMEQMMGVAEPLPSHILEKITIKQATFKAKTIAWYCLVISSVKSLYQLATLDRQIKQFFKLLEEALSTSHKPIEQMSLSELGSYYRKLEKALINNWNAPLINDFYCMIFFGISRKLLKKYCGTQGEQLHNSFLKHQGNIISAEPAKRIKEMALIAAQDKILISAMQSKDPSSMDSAVKNNPKFSKLLKEYMDKFSDRCLEELKLESLTIADDPYILYESILAFALVGSNAGSAMTHQEKNPYQQLNRLMKGSLVKRFILGFLIRFAVKLIRNRENLRFERTRLFGTVRKIATSAGRNLQGSGKIDDYRDIFYLEVNELLGIIEGRLTTLDLKGLIALRKKQAEEFASMPDPPSRFFITGPVAINLDKLITTQPGCKVNVGNTKSGIGCCPGIIRAKVRVIHDPKTDTLRPGEILVAKFTDPGWIMLFANASGILVERGSLLSHSAIVAREMGIPAIVSVPGLMDWLKSGEEVEFDGTTGVIKKLQ